MCVFLTLGDYTLPSVPTGVVKAGSLQAVVGEFSLVVLIIEFK